MTNLWPSLLREHSQSRLRPAGMVRCGSAHRGRLGRQPIPIRASRFLPRKARKAAADALANASGCRHIFFPPRAEGGRQEPRVARDVSDVPAGSALRLPQPEFFQIGHEPICKRTVW